MKPTKEMLEKYIDQELTLDQMAERLGCTRQNVLYHLRKHGLRRQDKREGVVDKSAWTQRNLCWVAGLLEGEGSFTKKTNHNTGIISMQMHTRDLDVLYKLQSIVGGNIYGPYNGREVFQWAIGKHEHVVEVCKALYPYMGERRKQQIEEILSM